VERIHRAGTETATEQWGSVDGTIGAATRAVHEVLSSRRVGTDVTGGSDRCPSGVYVIDEAERERVLRHGAFPPGFVLAILDGAAVDSRARFFQELAQALRFPDYFGHNWDAVYDCLTDLNWLPATGYALVVDGFDHLATNEPQQWEIGLKVLREACAFWQPLSRPMYALLRGPSELAPGEPALASACFSSWRDN
jgi:RNAse (barnase) inhibitor barstar